jgi:hypothetical protein
MTNGDVADHTRSHNEHLAAAVLLRDSQQTPIGVVYVEYEGSEDDIPADYSLAEQVHALAAEKGLTSSLATIVGELRANSPRLDLEGV